MQALPLPTHKLGRTASTITAQQSQQDSTATSATEVLRVCSRMALQPPRPRRSRGRTLAAGAALASTAAVALSAGAFVPAPARPGALAAPLRSGAGPSVPGGVAAAEAAAASGTNVASGSGGSAAGVIGAAALLAGAYVGAQRQSGFDPLKRANVPTTPRQASKSAEPDDINYLALLGKGDLPKRIFTVLGLLALARIGFYVPLYGFDADAVGEYFGRQATTNLGFVDQLFGGGLGKVSLFSLGIGPYITSSIIFQILSTITPSLKALAQGEEGEAGREKYKGYIKNGSFFFALVQGFGQAQSLSPYVFDNGPVWALQVTLQFAFGAMFTIYCADQITEQKLGNGSSLLVFSSIVANLPRTIGATVAKASADENGAIAGAVFGLALLVTILGLVVVLNAERRIPILFAKRLQDDAAGQGATDDGPGGSYLPIKLNASGVLPLIFAGSLLSLPALAANYTKATWLTPLAKSLLPGEPAYIPLSMVMIGLFSYVSTFQVLDPKDMAKNLRKQAAAIPQIRPGRETEEYLRDVLTRSSIFGAVILAVLFVLPNLIEAITKLTTPNSFGGTSLLILVGVAADTWRQLQAELLMQQYATDVDKFYKGKKRDS